MLFPELRESVAWSERYMDRKTRKSSDRPVSFHLRPFNSRVGVGPLKSTPKFSWSNRVSLRPPKNRDQDDMEVKELMCDETAQPVSLSSAPVMSRRF